MTTTLINYVTADEESQQGKFIWNKSSLPLNVFR